MPLLKYVLNRQQAGLLVEILQDLLGEDTDDGPAKELLRVIASQHETQMKSLFGDTWDAPHDPRKDLPFEKEMDYPCPACSSTVDLIQAPDGPVLLCRDYDCKWEKNPDSEIEP